MWFVRGDDGLTDRQRRKFARRFWKVANAPISQETRDKIAQLPLRRLHRNEESK